MNHQTIHEICTLEDEQAIRALNELRKPNTYIRGTKGTKLEIKVKLTTADTRKELSARALIDSGCVGSCIDLSMIHDHQLNTTPLP